MQRIPVIIPAHNEELRIGATLDRLDAATTWPIVISNDSHDGTVAVAEEFGATVIDLEAPGKMPALQAGVKYLGERALDPVIYLDADSYPVFPRSWAAAMTRSYDAHTGPAATNGMIAYHEGSVASDSIRTAYRAYRSVGARLSDDHRIAHGANMSTRFATQELLAAYIDMPHIWPGEDRAIAKLVLNHGGVFTPLVDPRSAVSISSRYCMSVQDRLRLGRRRAGVVRQQGYLARAAAGSRLLVEK